MDRTQGFYHRHETESSAARQARQWQSVLAVIQKAASFDGEFRDRLTNAGIVLDEIRTLDDFSTIPVLRKKDLSSLQRDKGLGWFCFSAPGRLSTHLPISRSHLRSGRQQSGLLGMDRGCLAGFRQGDLAQMTFSYHLTPAGLMLEEPLRTLGCAVIPGRSGNSSVQLQLLRELPVTGFVGMTSFLKTLGQKAQDKGLDPKADFRLKVAFVAASASPKACGPKSKTCSA